MQPSQDILEKKQISAFVVTPAKLPNKAPHFSSQQKSFAVAQRRSMTITALQNNKADKYSSSLVPAPQAGAAIIRPGAQTNEYSMIKMPSGNRMLFKRVDAEQQQPQFFGLGSRFRRMFGSNPLATFKAVKLRPPVYKPEEDVTYEANSIVNSLKI